MKHTLELMNNDYMAKENGSNKTNIYGSKHVGS